MNIKVAARITVSLIVISILWLIGLKISRIGKYEISIQTSPRDTITLIDGNEIKGNGSIFVSPGEYNLTGSRIGFEDDNTTVTVNKNLDVIILPTPNSPEADKLLIENPEIQIERENLGGIRAQQEGNVFRNNNPILSVLPYKGVLYDINYSINPNDSERIMVQISANTSHKRSLAIQKIRSLGYEPTDYVIDFVDLREDAVFLSESEISREDNRE